MITLALLAWPLVTLVLVLRLPFHKAVLISILGGFLLLPVRGGMDLPILPPFEKDTIPALTLLVLAIVVARGRHQVRGSPNPHLSHDRPGWIPRSVSGVVGLLLFVLGSLITAMTNAEPLVYGPISLPGMHPYDGFALALSALTMLAPLLLGRKFFAHPDQHALLLRGLVVAGLAYSLLVLYEIRMSPQLNNMVYGFFPHSWLQHVRGEGWRPVVFMEHGLQLTIFLSTVTLAAFGASRCLEPRRRGFYFLAGAWLLGTLTLSNSLGALIIVVMLLPAVLFLGFRVQLVCAAIIAATIIIYPMLRSVDVVPTDRLVAIAETISTERARSLQFRFDNEDILLEHAREKPLFGWGGWGRNRIFDEAGRDISVTDGAWIIVMGVRGWIGYLGQFGLLALPVVLLAVYWRRYEVSSVTAVLALVLAAALVDLIPNAFLSPVVFLLAGAMWGRLELGVAVQGEGQVAVTMPQRGQLACARANFQARGPGGKEDISVDCGGVGSAYTRQITRHRRDRKSY